MSPSGLVAVGFAVTAATAAVRLGLLWVRAPEGERAAPWRLATLLAAQPLLAVLLHLGLFPPPAEGAAGAGVLAVAVRGAPSLVPTAPGERLVVLPGAPAGLGGERAPDLATALRRHPDAGRLRVVGDGLEPRDREALGGRALRFDPAPPRRGLQELHAPAPTAPGAAFTAAGRAAGLGGGWAELRDPAGRRIDRRPLAPSGEFTLAGAAREPGAVLFTVTLRDRADAVVETVDLPVVTPAPAPRRVLVLAGSAGPEVKALRRWGADAGLDLRAAVAAGGGLELGDPRPPLTAAALDALDLVVVDERSWAALSAGERAALASAVGRGLGLLLRVTGPPAPTVREAWRGLGLPLSPGEDVAPVRLPPPPATPEADTPPELTRRGADAPSPGSAPLLRDASGAVLARWRAEGQGRLGVWTVTDSAGLTTAGFGDRYGELWGALFAILGRAAPAQGATPVAPAVAGRRAVVCGLAGEAEVTGPGAATARLLPDATGCAAYWPTEGGWRTLRPAAPTGRSAPASTFYIRPADQAPGVTAQEDRVATEALVTDVGARAATSAPRSAHSGPSWRWLSAWLLAAGAVWWLERASAGRRPRAQGGGDPRLSGGTSTDAGG